LLKLKILLTIFHYNAKMKGIARWVIMPKTLVDIKKILDCQLGNRIVLRANGGRKKLIERRGVLKETYPSVFVVELDQEQHNFERVSYTYTDVLTENVQVTFVNDQQEEFLVQ